MEAWIEGALKKTSVRLVVINLATLVGVIAAYSFTAPPSSVTETAKSDSRSISSTADGKPTPQQEISSTSLRSYLEEENNLHDRYAELEHFRRDWTGRRVRWTGYVERATAEDGVTVWFGLRRDRQTGAMITFPLRFKSRALELRPGNVVEVIGTISRADGGPILTGESLRLVAPER